MTVGELDGAKGRFISALQEASRTFVDEVVKARESQPTGDVGKLVAEMKQLAGSLLHEDSGTCHQAADLLDKGADALAAAVNSRLAAPGEETVAKALALLIRYRKETPLGHQPHMIAHEADEVIVALGGLHGQ